MKNTIFQLLKALKNGGANYAKSAKSIFFKSVWHSFLLSLIITILLFWCWGGVANVLLGIVFGFVLNILFFLFFVIRRLLTFVNGEVDKGTEACTGLISQKMNFATQNFDAKAQFENAKSALTEKFSFAQPLMGFVTYEKVAGLVNPSPKVQKAMKYLNLGAVNLSSPQGLISGAKVAYSLPIFAVAKKFAFVAVILTVIALLVRLLLLFV